MSEHVLTQVGRHACPELGKLLVVDWRRVLVLTVLAIILVCVLLVSAILAFRRSWLQQVVNVLLAAVGGPFALI